jgi:cytochrome d ubiquinol oxidase subunit I
MNSLLAARAQMEVSLGFHMVFAALGIGMPLLMLIAEGMWLRTGQPHYRTIAVKWAKATAITFAIGAVSGTALSFELGLLWPRFMAFSGSTIGTAFALEAYAFFIEAIFLGLYLYGWDRLSPRAHWWTGVPVAVSGLVSGVLVVAANAWMQAPVGSASGDPTAPFRSPAWIHMSLHSSLSCYIATSFAVAGVYAAGMLRGHRNELHSSALGIALVVGTVAAVLQPISGDFTARKGVQYQPLKLAAMEALYETGPHAPLTIGGIPDANGNIRFGITIPSGLSLLVHRNPNGVVRGLNDFPRDTWPNVVLTHIAFQLMVGFGFTLIGLSALYWWARRKRTLKRLALIAALIASPMGFLALEAGWIVTEAGRQPWIIYNVMRTADGVTPVQTVNVTFFGFTLLYIALGITLVVLLRSLARQPAHEEVTGGAHEA